MIYCEFNGDKVNDSIFEKSFEWLVNYSHFRKYILKGAQMVRESLKLKNHVSLIEQSNIVSEKKNNTLTALVLGCGTSDLSFELVNDEVCGSVLSLDIQKRFINIMREKFKKDKRLEWETIDFTDIKQMDKLINEKRFDLIIDKATFDAILCEEKSGHYINTVFRYLRCGGVYILVSLHEPDLLRPIFDYDFGRQDLKLFIEQFSVNDLERTLIIIHDVNGINVKRGCSAEKCFCTFPDILIENVHRHISTILDCYLTMGKPLLNHERAEKLRHDFEKIMKKSDKERIPIKMAYSLMFSNEECDMYTFEDFLEDLYDSDIKMAERETISIIEAMDFFRKNQ